MSLNPTICGTSFLAKRVGKMKLHGIFREFAEAAGEEATLKIARAKGGMEVNLPALDTFYIYEKRDGKHWLSEIVGREAAIKILSVCVATVGLRVCLPTGRSLILRAEIKERTERGESVREIVQAVRCSPRTVYRWRRLLKEKR
jgi:hypothetical protein